MRRIFVWVLMESFLCLMRSFCNILYAFILLIDKEDICICVDGIILQHVTSNLALFICLAHNYIIFWPQMQTNINNITAMAALWLEKTLKEVQGSKVRVEEEEAARRHKRGGNTEQPCMPG
jgi:hypothetical protein